jgi:hypothetical protein
MKFGFEIFTYALKIESDLLDQTLRLEGQISRFFKDGVNIIYSLAPRPSITCKKVFFFLLIFVSVVKARDMQAKQMNINAVLENAGYVIRV